MYSFVEGWPGGLTDPELKVRRIRLSDVHRRRDRAAQTAVKDS